MEKAIRIIKWIISVLLGICAFQFIKESHEKMLSGFILLLMAIGTNPLFTDFLKKRNINISRGKYIGMMVGLFVLAAIVSPSTAEKETQKEKENNSEIVTEEASRNIEEKVMVRNDAPVEEEKKVSKELAVVTMPATETESEKTPKPTEIPTLVPSEEPTPVDAPRLTIREIPEEIEEEEEIEIEPTEIPTPDPTPEPTATPTPTPTPKPTNTPTPSPKPTPKPTPRPTNTPTPVPVRNYTGKLDSGSNAGRVYYVVNINPDSNKFHTYGCQHVSRMSAKNKMYATDNGFASASEARAWLISHNYSPCGTCKP